MYLAYGHDEEVGGTFGAVAIARLLESRGVHLAFVLDEAGIVLSDGVAPFVSAPVAIIGTAEKVCAIPTVHALDTSARRRSPDAVCPVYAGVLPDGGPLPFTRRPLSNAASQGCFSAPQPQAATAVRAMRLFIQAQTSNVECTVLHAAAGCIDDGAALCSCG